MACVVGELSDRLFATEARVDCGNHLAQYSGWGALVATSQDFICDGVGVTDCRVWLVLHLTAGDIVHRRLRSSISHSRLYCTTSEALHIGFVTARNQDHAAAIVCHGWSIKMKSPNLL